MSPLDSVNGNLLQSQLTAAQLHQGIGFKVAAKTLDAARNQGEMVVALLDQAVEMAQTVSTSSEPALTIGAVVSGLGQNLDMQA